MSQLDSEMNARSRYSMKLLMLSAALWVASFFVANVSSCQ